MSSDHGSGIHFVKRIEECTLRNGELRIPRSFVNKCWEEISNPLFLLLPNGSKWEMNWRKINGEVWLIHKWKKFAEFFSLDQDHLLLFTYVGSSQFKVVIIDRSGLEVVYPLMEGSLDSAENGISLRQRMRATFFSPFSPSTKKVKTNPRKELNSNATQDVETKCAQSQRNRVEMLNKFSGDRIAATKPKKRGRRSIRRCSKSKFKATGNDTALDRANSFHSENPFFIRQMHPSYILKNFLAMPASFITDEELKGNARVRLWISEERCWDTNYYVNSSSRQIMLGSGWGDFVKENNLKIGNVCVFEKVKKPGISIRVVIFRDAQESSTSNVPAGDDDGANRSKQTELGTTVANRGRDGIPKKYPNSEFVRQNYEMSENQFVALVQANVCIPAEFIRAHKMENAAKVILRVENRTWPVKLDHYPEFECHRLSNGWSNFLRESKLNGGEICNFELVDEDRFVFQVRVAICID